MAKQCEVDSLVSWVKNLGYGDYRSSQVSQRSRCHSCPSQTWRRPCWVTEQLTEIRIPSLSRISKHLTGARWTPHRHLTSVALEGDGALWLVGRPGWSCGLLEGLVAHEAAGPASPRELDGICCREGRCGFQSLRTHVSLEAAEPPNPESQMRVTHLHHSLWVRRRLLSPHAGAGAFPCRGRQSEGQQPQLPCWEGRDVTGSP